MENDGHEGDAEVDQGLELPDRVPLTVCPNSNVVIANRFASLREHPFRAMREAGLLATLNTDDPAMTDLDLGKEYRTVAEAQGFDFEEIAAAAGPQRAPHRRAMWTPSA
ncbi:MAG: hypothetical protein ABI565_14490 [Vicinamibacteria bacterium]